MIQEYTVSINVIKDANDSVQNACEMHKKLADKKKWVKQLEKRVQKAIRDKCNSQRQQF